MFIKNYKALLEEFSAGLNKTEQNSFHHLLNFIEESNYFGKLKKITSNNILNEKENKVFQNFLVNQKKQDEIKKSYLTNTLVMVLKATRLCNLRCTYCNAWRSGPNQVMTFPVLLRTIYHAINTPGVRAVQFVWHGGETTLLSTDYFKKALWLQQQFKKTGQMISNSIQTNATRLTEEWLMLFKNYEFSVGVSIDGPPEVNDKRRVTKGKKPTSGLIEKGISLLKEYHIPFGVLTVIDDEIFALGAKRFLEYFDSIQVNQIAILNVIPDNTSLEKVSGTYLTWDKHIAFMQDLFSLWVEKYQNKIMIRELQSLYSSVKKYDPNAPAGVCIFAGHCMGEYLTVDPNGDIHACDKYVDDKQYFFGNLLQHENLYALLKKSKNLDTAITEQKIDYQKMEECRWNKVCRGGCPHDLRLNKNFNKNYSEKCCGLKNLLNHMEDYYAKRQCATS